uniref:Lipase n=1 Tax=Anoplophora glabripennis TaxID=217634 RepID=V5GMQ9_ANOGL
MMALGPAVYCKNLTSPIVRILKDHYKLVESIADYFNLTAEILGHTFIIETALKLICKNESQYQEVCPLILFLLFGFDSEQFERSIVTTMVEVFPAGLSMKELKHYLQLVKSGHFRQFDHGELNNLEIYKKSSPPDYDISRVTAPVALYYGKNDWLVGTADIDQLAEELPNLVENYLIEYDYFNHMDFIVAKDVVSLLYFDLINKLNEINGLAPLPATSTVSTNYITTTLTNDPTTQPSYTETESQSFTTPGSALSINNFARISFLFVLMLRFVR